MVPKGRYSRVKEVMGQPPSFQPIRFNLTRVVLMLAKSSCSLENCGSRGNGIFQTKCLNIAGKRLSKYKIKRIIFRAILTIVLTQCLYIQLLPLLPLECFFPLCARVTNPDFQINMRKKISIHPFKKCFLFCLAEL